MIHRIGAVFLQIGVLRFVILLVIIIQIAVTLILAPKIFVIVPGLVLHLVQTILIVPALTQTAVAPLALIAIVQMVGMILDQQDG